MYHLVAGERTRDAIRPGVRKIDEGILPLAPHDRALVLVGFRLPCATAVVGTAVVFEVTFRGVRSTLPTLYRHIHNLNLIVRIVRASCCRCWRCCCCSSSCWDWSSRLVVRVLQQADYLARLPCAATAATFSLLRRLVWSIAFSFLLPRRQARTRSQYYQVPFNIGKCGKEFHPCVHAPLDGRELDPVQRNNRILELERRLGRAGYRRDDALAALALDPHAELPRW